MQQVEVKEEEVGKVKNEVARVKVDALNTKAHQGVLSTKVDDLNGDLAQRCFGNSAEFGESLP